MMVDCLAFQLVGHLVLLTVEPMGLQMAGWSVPSMEEMLDSALSYHSQ